MIVVLRYGMDYAPLLIQVAVHRGQPRSHDFNPGAELVFYIHHWELELLNPMVPVDSFQKS